MNTAANRLNRIRKETERGLTPFVVASSVELCGWRKKNAKLTYMYVPHPGQGPPKKAIKFLEDRIKELFGYEAELWFELGLLKFKTNGDQEWPFLDLISYAKPKTHWWQL